MKHNSIDNLPVVEGIDWNYAWLHLPDMALLEYTVTEFRDMIESSAEELTEFYKHIEEKDMLERYCIKVHGMKSSAALIGAVPLAGVAKILEYAAKDGRMDRIHAMTPIFIEEWLSYKEKLNKVF